MGEGRRLERGDGGLVSGNNGLGYRRTAETERRGPHCDVGGTGQEAGSDLAVGRTARDWTGCAGRTSDGD